MEKLILDRNTLRRFGLTMGAVFLAISLLIALWHRISPSVTLIVSGLFFISALVLPTALKPIYISWFRLAFILGWINTRLILLIIFYTIFAPVGLVLRLLGVDLLDRRINKDKQSYWSVREKKGLGPLSYEKQF